MEIKDIILKAGGPTAVGRICNGISSQAVSQWVKVPTQWVIPLSDAIGIPEWEIDPGTYPPERFKKAA